MNLYLYDHCPYCVRAEMVANYKQVNQQNIYLANDDEESCYKLIGAKVLPILEHQGDAMGESLDIAKRLDELGHPDKIIAEGGHAKDVLEVLNQVNFSINCLLFPRNIRIGLPEFKTQSAQDYFEGKKEKIIDMPFATAMDQTQEHIEKVEHALGQLPSLSLPSDRENTLSWDDVLVYPVLRNLTMVANLTFPDSVQAYIDEVSQLTQTHTYFDKAI